MIMMNLVTFITITIPIIKIHKVGINYSKVTLHIDIPSGIQT